MKPHEQTLLNRIGKILAPTLSRVLASRRTADVTALVESYLSILLGRGAGTGWAMAAEISVACRLIERADPIILDVGANVGDWSQEMKRSVPAARLWMVEAQFECQQFICDRAIPDATLVGKAISAHAGTVTLYRSQATDGLASLQARGDSYFQDRNFVSQNVQSTTLDEVVAEYALDEVDFLKLDIEGHELAALKGAESSLRSQRIKALSFEFGSGNVNSRTFFRDFWDLLHPLGYAIARVTPAGQMIVLERYYEDCEYFRGVSNYVAWLR